MLPTAQSAFSDSDILSIATEELQERLCSLVRSVQQDYYVASQDISLVSGTLNYALPQRASGMSVREVHIVDPSGIVVNDPPQVSLDRLGFVTDGFYFKGDDLWVVNDPGTTTNKLRVYFYMRPNPLVLSASAGAITIVNTGAKSVTFSGSPPSGFVSGVNYDLIKGKPGFDILAWDEPATIAGSVLTFTNSLPAGLAVGDWVSLANQSPVIQLPPEMHAVLAQAVKCRILESQDRAEGLSLAETKLTRMEADAVRLLTPRATGEVQKVLPRVTPLSALTGRMRMRRP